MSDRAVTGRWVRGKDYFVEREDEWSPVEWSWDTSVGGDSVGRGFGFSESEAVRMAEAALDAYFGSENPK